MPLARCPHCLIALTDDEVAATACPVCTLALRDAPSVPAAKPRPLVLPAVVFVCVVAALAVVAWRVWPRPEQRPTPLPNPVALDVLAKPDQPKPPAPTPLVHKPADDPEPIAAEPRPEPEAVALLETLPDPLTEVAVTPTTPRPLAREEFVGNTVKLDSPDEDVSLADAADDNRLTLTGRVRSLTLGGVNNAAVVDASQLSAKRIVVRGEVNGGTKILLRADEVVFEKAVTGDAEIVVVADKVVFQGTLDGSCRFDLTARRVDLRGRVAGGARVLATLTSGGSLDVATALEGGLVQHRKANKNDPEPKVTRGEIKGGARVVQVPPKADE